MYDKDASDDHTVYVEYLRAPYHTVEAVRGLFGKYGLVAYAALHHDQHGRFQGFAFVRYHSTAGVTEAIRRLNSFPDPNDLVDPSSLDLDPQFAALQLRVMSKKRWLVLKEEYLAHMKQCQVAVQAELKRHTKPHTFREGTIVRFHGVMVGTSNDVLKTFFDRFGAVEHVDHLPTALSGYVRFAEPSAAQACVSYFANHRIVHCDPADTMGQLIEHSEADTFEPLVIIRVKVLQGKEELNYWSKVRAIWRQQKAQSSTMPPLADRAPSSDGARHLRFDSPE